jgi:hypothetical protein
MAGVLIFRNGIASGKRVEVHNMIRTFCLQYEKDWDDGVHLLLFAAREAVQESFGFSPFELVFGHTVRGPLKLVKEKWLDEHTDLILLDYVSKFKESQSFSYWRQNVLIMFFSV